MARSFECALLALTCCLLWGGCGQKPVERLPKPPLTTHADSGNAKRPTQKAEPLVSASEALRTAPMDWERSRMMGGLLRLKTRMKTTSYVHGIDVDTRRGHYGFDCSGMVDWVLRDAAPVAHRSLRQTLGRRPLARDFVDRVARLEPSAERSGWKRIASVADAEPGDIIAWLRPKFIKSQNTGHVAVVVQKPRLRAPDDTAYLVRVADSSRLRHEDDSRNGQGGFGFGTILIQTDGWTGSPSGFSFAGSRAEHAWGTKVVIGRPVR